RLARRLALQTPPRAVERSLAVDTGTKLYCRRWATDWQGMPIGKPRMVANGCTSYLCGDFNFDFGRRLRESGDNARAAAVAGWTVGAKETCAVLDPARG